MAKERVLFREWEDVPGKGRNKYLQFQSLNIVCFILQQLHDAPSASHLGVAKTLKKISSRFYWPGNVRMWRIGVSPVSYVRHGNLLLGNGRLNCGQNSPAIHSSGWQ